MASFGYQVFITILLPGMMLFGSAWLVLERHLSNSSLHALLTSAFSKDWLAAALLLLVSSLLGTFLASVLDFVESYTFDPVSRRRLNLDEGAYWAEWDRYVDQLSTENNSFVSQMVLYYFFESRGAVASAALSISWIVYVGMESEALLALPLLALAAMLWRAAQESHDVLAEYRHRNFSDNS